MANVITPKNGEEILLTLRKNPNKFSKEIIKGLALLILPVLAFIFFNNPIVLTIATVLVLSLIHI